MSRRPIELADGRSRYVIVPRAHIDRRPSELAARRLLDDALREGGPSTAGALERLAEELAGREVRGPREATAILVRALSEGRLVAVALPRPVRPLAEVEPTDLRTLGGWDVDAPLQPRVTPLTPQPVAPTTWVSFEVVDERGASADGRYRITLDARLEHGELAQRRHRFDGLPEAVRVDLTVEDLRWDDASPRPDAPSRDDDPRPAGDGLFSIELVDDRGEPLRGCFTLAEGDRRLAEGVISHRWRRALPGGEPVMLELTELRAQQEPR
jgi:hypothetical protein